MSLFRIRNFLISFLLFVFTSCSLLTTKGYLEQVPNVNTIENCYFSNPDKDYVYKAHIEIYKHNFSGLLIVKMINSHQHRIVFVTEFGKKIFDFEIINDSLKVNSILEDLNKKVIINTLQKDFQILVKQNNKVLKEFKKDDKIAYQTRLKEQFNYYFISNENKELIKIINTSRKKEKMFINFDEVENEIAIKIDIIHLNIKLKIHLKYLDD